MMQVLLFMAAIVLFDVDPKSETRGGMKQVALLLVFIVLWVSSWDSIREQHFGLMPVCHIEVRPVMQTTPQGYQKLTWQPTCVYW